MIEISKENQMGSPISRKHLSNLSTHFCNLYNNPLFFFIFPGGCKVYDVSNYLDDHPGGAEVMLDVSGQNADEFFEDIGHSGDARKELEKHLIGTYKLSEEEIEKMKKEAEKRLQSNGSSMTIVIFVALIAIIFAYTQGYF